MTGAVLVTGGAGYIGSHAVLALCDTDREVVVVDNLSSGSAESVPSALAFYNGEVSDAELMGSVIRRHGVDVVMHFAASTSAPGSIDLPLDYYWNNTVASLALARTCLDAGVGRFIFSSSAAVYGGAGGRHLREDDPVSPITPYGASKLMTEIMLRDLSTARPEFRAVSLRYFNVAGADPGGRAGQRKATATSLIDIAVDVALGNRACLDVWGDDYDTRDGSGERDYVHVSDLAAVHLAAARYLETGGAGGVFNCGYGRGHTVLEVVSALEAILGHKLPWRGGPRRAGDIPGAVANVDRLRAAFDWVPRYDSLETILRTALAWRGWKSDEAGRAPSLAVGGGSARA